MSRAAQQKYAEKNIGVTRTFSEALVKSFPGNATHQRENAFSSEADSAVKAIGPRQEGQMYSTSAQKYSQNRSGVIELKENPYP